MRVLRRIEGRPALPTKGDEPDSDSHNEAEHHVTTERLKQQFEERLAARLRRRRGSR